MTRQPVVRGGRAMMRCSGCHEVSIGDHHPTVVARYKRYNALVWAGTIVAGIALFIEEFGDLIDSAQDFGVRDLPFLQIFATTSILLVAVWAIRDALRSAAAAIDPLNRSNRVEALALAIFWTIVTAGSVILLVMLPPITPPVAK